MTSGIGIVGGAQGGTVFTPVSPASSATTTSASSPASTNFGAASLSTNTEGTAASSNVLLHNPRVIDDPSAGFITEYLSANGNQVVYQSPSAVTVAYLRLGLTAQGLTKQQAADTGVVT